ncbi:MAG TPA: hypothetical protein VMH35_23155 [Streptosporangiaceae bacterium]|nr:hypothetical protein [Streptosporangiaceae bacterium]
MNTSPVSPDDIRAAAAAHQELGPEYSDAVVAAFLDRVDRAVAARAEARLALMRQASAHRASRRALVTGLAIGAGGGALAASLFMVGLDGGSPAPARQPQVVPNVQLLPVFIPGHGRPGRFGPPPRLARPQP